MQEYRSIAQQENSKMPVAKSQPLLIWAFVLLIIGVFLLSKYILAPYFTKLPSDFEYSANILSLDNFYDDKVKDFSGDSRSVSLFKYSSDGNQDGILKLKNLFEVKTIKGETIIKVERNYNINASSWQHTKDGGSNKQPEYLFGPHLKGVPESFFYRHVNYDNPFEMQRVGRETVDGLITIRYKGEQTIDQTKNLQQLPKVKGGLGVSTDAVLNLWVDPTTGWLIKYEDYGKANYFDPNTKEILDPWNKFSNRFTKKSISEQVVKAKEIRLIVNGITYGIPALLTIIVLLILILKRQLPKRGPLIIISVLILAFVGLLIYHMLPQPNKKLVIGISRWVPIGNNAYNDNIEGFKNGIANAGYVEGKDVEYILEVADANPDKAKEIAQKFLDMKVDLIFSQTTPGTEIIKKSISDIPVIFSIVTYPVEAGLIKSNQSSGNNLVGSRNWISASSHLDVLVKIIPNTKSIGFIHRAGETNSSLQLKEFESVAKSYGIKIVEIAGKNLKELESALMASNTVDSLFSACDTLVQGEAEETIIAFAKENKIPSFSCNPTGPEKGDLAALTADFYQIGKEAGESAAMVLQGITPTTLLTVSTKTPSLQINKKTADYLGLNIPQNLLLLATKIYE